MDISDRLKAVVLYAGKSTRAVAIQCGINQPTLDRQIKKINNVNTETLSAILKTFPEISGDWILTGEGYMLKSENKNEIEVRLNERIDKLLNTIETLQETIDTKNDTIDILTNKIKELEQKLNN